MRPILFKSLCFYEALHLAVGRLDRGFTLDRHEGVGGIGEFQDSAYASTGSAVPVWPACFLSVVESEQPQLTITRHQTETSVLLSFSRKVQTFVFTR